MRIGSKRTKEKKMKKKRFAVPAKLYVIIAVFSVCFFFVALAINCTHPEFAAFIENISCGLIASDLVAALTDLALTKRRQNADDMIYTRMVASLKDALEMLPSDICVAVYEIYGYDKTMCYDFSGWFHHLMTEPKKEGEKEKRSEELTDIERSLKYIRNKARSLKESSQFLDNDQFTEEFFKNLEVIDWSSFDMIVSINKKDYVKVERLMNDWFKPTVISLFGDLESDYTEQYDELHDK